jgi:hypothetical protein
MGMMPTNLLDLSQSDPNIVLSFEPDFAIREKIGKEVVLTEVFTPERIEICQKIIEDARSAFFGKAESDSSALLELVKNYPTSPEGAARFFDEVFSRVGNIKGQVEIFGFVLIRKICGHILECCSSENDSLNTRYMLIRDLVQVLHLSIKEMVTDEGGNTGHTMLSELKDYSVRKDRKT